MRNLRSKSCRASSGRYRIRTLPARGSFQRYVLVASFKDYPRLIDHASQQKWASRPEGKLENRSRRSLHARQIDLLRPKTTGADRNLQHPSSCVFPCRRRHRHGAHVRTFDMQIITKHELEYTFTSINKKEHKLTDTFLEDRKVWVKNETVPDGHLLLAAAGDDSDEELRVGRAGDDDDDANTVSK